MGHRRRWKNSIQTITKGGVISVTIRGDAEVDEIRASWENLTPEEATGRAIYELKEEAIKEIKSAKKETYVLSYKMLLVGGLLGALGSFFVASFFSFWELTTFGVYGKVFLVILGAIVFFGSIFYVGGIVDRLEKDKK